MERKRQGFFFYRAIFDSVSQLKKREKAIIYEAIFAYALDMEEPNMEGWSDTARVIWMLAKPMLDNDLRRFENGCKGGAPKGSHNNPRGRGVGTNREQTENKPTNNKNGIQEQEQEIKDNSLSLTPSHEVEEREDAEAEKERIFRIFFLKNFQHPAQEVERFYAHYEAQGWKRSGGLPITDRVALAQSWKPENENAKHFPDNVAQLIRAWYEAGTPKLRELVPHAFYGATIDENVVYLRVTHALKDEINHCADNLRKDFNQIFPGFVCKYLVPQIN